jgi:predicted transcriptional regulator of viral defense system
MEPKNTGYAQSQGIKLLESAVRDFGPILTLDQLKPIARTQQLSISHLRYLISALAASGWIEIIKRGTYVVKSDLYSGNISPFAIAGALIQPMAISHWSALSFHGFTTQGPGMIQASTPKNVITPEMRTGKADNPRGRAIWHAYGLEFEFIHLRKEAFWGFEKIWSDDWHQVNITDKERTALDLIARPDIFGGIAAAIEILEDSLDQIVINRLVKYALNYNKGSIIKRLGWVLEHLGEQQEILEPLQNFPVRRYYALDQNYETDAPRNARWQIIENLRRS